MMKDKMNIICKGWRFYTVKPYFNAKAPFNCRYFDSYKVFDKENYIIIFLLLNLNAIAIPSSGSQFI